MSLKDLLTECLKLSPGQRKEFTLAEIPPYGAMAVLVAKLLDRGEFLIVTVRFLVVFNRFFGKI